MLGSRQENFDRFNYGSGKKTGKFLRCLLILVFVLLVEILSNFIGYRFDLRAFVFCPFAFLIAVEIFDKFFGTLMATLIYGLYAKIIGFTFSINVYLVALFINLLFLKCTTTKMLMLMHLTALYLFSGPCDGWMFLLDSIYSFAIFCLAIKFSR